MSKHDKTVKTNAMRELDAAGLLYASRSFETAGSLSGLEIAHLLGVDPENMFKTLVTVGKSGEHFVFMIPVAEELDLKKAAEVVGEKAVNMIKSKELLPLTGYIHGGCSPIGMKKPFRTCIDETAQLFDEITFSGGRIGLQLTMAPENLEKIVPLTYADLTV